MKNERCNFRLAIALQDKYANFDIFKVPVGVRILDDRKPQALARSFIPYDPFSTNSNGAGPMDVGVASAVVMKVGVGIGVVLRTSPDCDVALAAAVGVIEGSL